MLVVNNIIAFNQSIHKAKVWEIIYIIIVIDIYECGCGKLKVVRWHERVCFRSVNLNCRIKNVSVTGKSVIQQDISALYYVNTSTLLHNLLLVHLREDLVVIKQIVRNLKALVRSWNISLCLEG